jgi:hypothetical protein
MPKFGTPPSLGCFQKGGDEVAKRIWFEAYHVVMG